MIKKVKTWVRRKINASKWGMKFDRSSNFKIPKSITILGKKSDIRYVHDEGTRVAFINIFLDDCYGLCAIQRPVRKILDIGAHVGFFSVAARSTFPSATIHAYEPNDALVDHLEFNSKIAGFSYFMSAVGKENGNITLDVRPNSVLTRSDMDRRGPTPMVAFRNAVSRMGDPIDIVKMDCEGAEWALFEDAQPWNSVRLLTMEYHLWPNHTHLEIKERLHRLGFKVMRQQLAENDGMLMAVHK